MKIWIKTYPAKGVEENEAFAVFEISDNGIGIPEHCNYSDYFPDVFCLAS